MGSASISTTSVSGWPMESGTVSVAEICATAAPETEEITSTAKMTIDLILEGPGCSEAASLFTLLVST